MIGSRPTFVRNDQFTGTPTATASGSREHFFHFLLGYLLPLIHAQTRYRFDRFLVLDCGPLMTPILEETLKRLDWQFAIVRPGETEVPIYVDAWDYAWTSTRAIRAAANLVSSAWKNDACPQQDCPLSENLLIARSASHAYYTQGAAEVGGYGTSRRGITNWPEIHEFLSSRSINHVVYEPGRHSLGCQIAAFSGARRIAGMRGAEWANAIWSQPGVRVRVLDPDPPAELLTRFLNRAGVRYEFAIAPQWHAPENPIEVARFLTER